MNEAEKAADRAGHFFAVLNQVAFLLERNDPGREGQHPTKSDAAVALSIVKSALAYDAKMYPEEQLGPPRITTADDNPDCFGVSSFIKAKEGDLFFHDADHYLCIRPADGSGDRRLVRVFAARARGSE